MTLIVHHHVPRADLALGLVRVEGIDAGPAPPELASALDALVRERTSGGLSPEEEALRQGSRDMLRNGRYKPTGRGKPASEYLLREASEGRFPRINGPVDANNLVSLRHLVPISLWDLDLALADAFEFRLGREGESYIFNEAGQALDLRDLVCGCIVEEPTSLPIVTPIKDSLRTKLKPEATRVAGAIYFPLVGGRARLEQVTREFLSWLLRCGSSAKGEMAVALPGESARL